MQANVDKLTTAATATGLFNLVTDRIFDENEKYPAFVVTDREDEPESIVSGQNVYFSRWRYTVHILEKFAEGYSSLENLTVEFLKQLAVGEWLLIDQRHSEFLISGRDILVNTMTLEYTVKQAFV